VEDLLARPQVSRPALPYLLEEKTGDYEMTAKSTIPIVVSRRFDQPAERVFDAWLDEASVGKWLFATPDGRIVKAEIDARVTGKWTIVDRRDGEDATHTGEYLEIDPPQRLVFTFAVDKYQRMTADRVTIEIVPQRADCELTLTHDMDAQHAEFAEQTAKGWKDILEGLAKTLG
jgi:uncharacterized protein YndB with AHSA1/START domain